MRCFQLPVLCSLLIILKGSGHANPLPGTTLENSPWHREEDKILSSTTENRKEEFLRSMNLSRVPTQEKTKIKPPKFMIDLYNRYVTDKKSMPASNIIRSFYVEDILLSSSMEISTQSHILLFNVSIPRYEEVTQAELKMYVSLSKSHTGYLLLHDVLHMETTEKKKEPHSFLASKEFKRSQWMTIDVTSAVKRWMNSEIENNKLEVFLKTKPPLESFNETSSSGATISTNHPPFLIVFSDDKCNRVKESSTEIRDLILHEEHSSLETISKNHALKYEEYKGENKNLPESKGRIKRSVEGNYCKRTQLIVNFKDIGWDSWIIGPKSYDAGECKGECYNPLTDNWTPTKHALVQTLMHQKFPKQIRRACCVPTKLESIQVLYMDNGVPTINNDFKEMRVVECGCR
ncbi:growth/differentiation factor 2 [Pelobates fuscus]|uniref:growth/differentiation factor 2 n=1 Tax=Pelobates fuscus TaxID=191477 RepID=UPI002FE4BFDB